MATTMRRHSEQTPIQKLAAAGKAGEVQELIEKHARSAGRAFEQLRANADLSDEGRRRQMATASVQARRGLDRDLEDLARTVKGVDRADAEQVFGLVGLPGDAASLAISRRDAGDRVGRITDRDEMLDLLRNATRIGDEVLARAIAQRAIDEGDAPTLKAFVEDRPDLEAPAQRLWDASKASGDVMALNMSLAALMPTELSDMSRSSIEALAQG